MFPDKFILATEACAGFATLGLTPPVLLGDFSEAENYAKYIIQDLNHWVAGWTDWNMALSMQVINN
jgi:glucosylceramidase